MKTPTDTELNIAVCKWMGWTEIEKLPLTGIGWSWVGSKASIGSTIPLPNYLSPDSPRRLLNEAEARLTQEQRVDFTNNLAQVCGSQMEKVFATARQRGIALLQLVRPEMFQ